jgi:hypothetical protein
VPPKKFKTLVKTKFASKVILFQKTLEFKHTIALCYGRQWWLAFQGHVPCHNPSLGFATKVRGLQGCGPKGRLESCITCSRYCKKCKKCEGMNPHTPKWTPESSKHDCRGQNPLVWKIIYIIENLLKHRCLKWARMTHLDI